MQQTPEMATVGERVCQQFATRYWRSWSTPCGSALGGDIYEQSGVDGISMGFLSGFADAALFERAHNDFRRALCICVIHWIQYFQSTDYILYMLTAMLVAT